MKKILYTLFQIAITLFAVLCFIEVIFPSSPFLAYVFGSIFLFLLPILTFYIFPFTKTLSNKTIKTIYIVILLPLILMTLISITLTGMYGMALYEGKPSEKEIIEMSSCTSKEVKNWNKGICRTDEIGKNGDNECCVSRALQQEERFLTKAAILSLAFGIFSFLYMIVSYLYIFPVRKKVLSLRN